MKSPLDTLVYGSDCYAHTHRAATAADAAAVAKSSNGRVFLHARERACVCVWKRERERALGCELINRADSRRMLWPPLLALIKLSIYFQYCLA